MSALTNAVASSSKRPAPSPATPSATPAKRPRAESHDEDEGDDDGEHDEPLQELDDSTRAKIARKEARVSSSRINTFLCPRLTFQTIRNRESAQRSRNQRKAHLANLEHRVAELERENRALRGESGSTPPPSRSAEREVSPANSVMSLANDLGLPHEMVSSSGGVNLATVAPPPADLDVDVDVKPIVTAAAALSPPRLPSTAPVFADVTALQNENSALRERIGLLENLVKQVVALSNLGGLPTTAPAPVQPEAASPDSVQAFDWDTLVAPAQPSRLETTLSPSMYPTQPLDAVAQTAVVKSETSEMNLACHPAAVVTCATPSQALQRARNPSSLETLEMTSARMETMARVVIAMARLRGWDEIRSTSTSMRLRSMSDKRRLRSARSRQACLRMDRRWGRLGMRE